MEKTKAFIYLQLILFITVKSFVCVNCKLVCKLANTSSTLRVILPARNYKLVVAESASPVFTIYRSNGYSTRKTKL